MRRFARMIAAACAVLLVPACGEYLPNAPEDLPDAVAPTGDWGLTLSITSAPQAVQAEGDVIFTATAAGGNGSYRWNWTLYDCTEDATGRERCDFEQTRVLEAGSTISFTRFRAAMDTRLRVTVRAVEVGGTRSGEAVHSVLGPNDRAD
ncbi:MAG TPA: hypothetical protein VFY65_10230 [Longimicrobium sp.]|nr:hypothetical protein [Longimicrobium sp.]